MLSLQCDIDKLLQKTERKVEENMREVELEVINLQTDLSLKNKSEKH